MEDEPKAISIVVPVYNEEGNIGSLHRQILAVCRENNYVFEIIIVDDGSTDNSLNLIKQLSPAKIIRFRKNFGQTAAIDAGIKYAKHNYIVTMDGDGQNDPADIPRLIEHLEKNELDVVSGWRYRRKDAPVKRIISKGAEIIRKIIIKDHVHDSGCTLKVYRRECFNGLSLYGEMHRFIPALLMRSGFKTGEIKVNHLPRQTGKSKYNWKRTIKGFVDMLSIAFWYKYSSRPLHLLGGLGLFFIMLSLISGAITFANFMRGQGMSETAWPLLTVFFFLAGLQLFVSGLTIDVLLKNLYETTDNQAYSIKETIVNGQEEADE
jgi:glycosyltransferase involved in cell wall biosynthesis